MIRTLCASRPACLKNATVRLRSQAHSAVTTAVPAARTSAELQEARGEQQWLTAAEVESVDQSVAEFMRKSPAEQESIVEQEYSALLSDPVTAPLAKLAKARIDALARAEKEAEELASTPENTGKSSVVIVPGIGRVRVSNEIANSMANNNLPSPVTNKEAAEAYVTLAAMSVADVVDGLVPRSEAFRHLANHERRAMLNRELDLVMPEWKPPSSHTYAINTPEEVLEEFVAWYSSQYTKMAKRPGFRTHVEQLQETSAALSELETDPFVDTEDDPAVVYQRQLDNALDLMLVSLERRRKSPALKDDLTPAEVQQLRADLIRVLRVPEIVETELGASATEDVNDVRADLSSITDTTDFEVRVAKMLKAPIAPLQPLAATPLLEQHGFTNGVLKNMATNYSTISRRVRKASYKVEKRMRRWTEHFSDLIDGGDVNPDLLKEMHFAELMRIRTMPLQQRMVLHAQVSRPVEWLVSTVTQRIHNPGLVAESFKPFFVNIDRLLLFGSSNGFVFSSLKFDYVRARYEQLIDHNAYYKNRSWTEKIELAQTHDLSLGSATLEWTWPAPLPGHTWVELPVFKPVDTSAIVPEPPKPSVEPVSAEPSPFGEPSPPPPVPSQRITKAYLKKLSKEQKKQLLQDNPSVQFFAHALRTLGLGKKK